MSLFDLSVGLMAPKLANLTHWIDQAMQWAEERGFDPEVLVQARLFPDQFTFARQVQSACDTAKFAASRVTASEAPSFADDETTLAQLKARVERTVAYLGEYSAADFEGAESNKVVLPFLPDNWVKPVDYLREFAAPNFYFHLTTAYAILRHNGVPLGKRTFLGSITLQPNED